MSVKWQPTDHPGIRYREHAVRRHSGRPDRYYTIRYYAQCKDFEEGLGWASEGWTAKKAAGVLAKLREAHATGQGAQSLAEMRDEAQAKREAEKRAVLAADLQGMTLAVFLREHYLPLAKRTKRTWDDDLFRIERYIIPELGAIPLRALRREDAERFLDGLSTREGLAPATVGQYLAILRRAYNVAAQTSIDGAPLLDGPSPMQGIRPPKVHNSRQRFLSYTEADRILVAAAGRNRDLHDAIVLALNTGLRLGELQRLDWLDVDLAHGVITVREGEQRKPGGKAFVNAEAEAVLRARRAGRAEGQALVFPPFWGKQRENLSHAFKGLVDELGINKGATDPRHKVVFHTLRHTFASWLAMAGTDIFRIKTLMRHKTITMTMRYAHLIPDATRAAVHNLRPPRPTGS